MDHERHADWGTPGGLARWEADTFEEEHDDYVALGRALGLGLVFVAGLVGLAVAVAPV